MTEREHWFTQTWSARQRPDGTLEPDAPIGGIGIGPEAEDLERQARMVRHLMTSFNKLPPTEPFFLIQGKFVLVPADRGDGEGAPADGK
jgi:hypothetical protein